MARKKTTAVYHFRDLRSISGGFAGISMETVSTVMHHHHDFYELVLIISGEWQHTIDNATTVLPAGTLCLFKPGVTHKLFTEPFKSTHFVICIEQNFFEKYISRVFPDFDYNGFSQWISKPISREKLKYVEHAGNEICKSNKPIHAMANELLLLLISDFLYDTSPLDCNSYVADIIQKLNNQLYINASVKEICSQYPYSQTMLLKEFKKITGMTIVEYKKLQKMEFACQLLSESDQTVIQVATSLQYDSLSYFVTTFKKFYHMTPSEYRKKHAVKSK